MAVTAGALAYFDLDSGAYEPDRTAQNVFKRTPWPKVSLLWGDPVYVISIAGSQAEVSAKGYIFKVPKNALTDKALLSLYQIDCGQGDAILIHTPDDRWLMVDGGPRRSGSGGTHKIAVDFLYWKLYKDMSWRWEFGHKNEPFKLDTVVCTHPDLDHYGGIHELTAKMLTKKDQATNGDLDDKPWELITIGRYIHNGMGRFHVPGMTKDTEYTKLENGSGFSQLGPVEGTTWPDFFLTQLMDRFSDVATLKDPAPPGRTWCLQDYYNSYGNFLQKLLDLNTAYNISGSAGSFQGNWVDSMRRAEHATGFLPGFETTPGNLLTIKVLGPWVEELNNEPALRFLDGGSKLHEISKSEMAKPSLTRNGQSVVLRVDYDKVRILLTGDLNFRSHILLRNFVPASEFSCHVAKACHHGSGDVSWQFLKDMNPLATMISSGDQEKYVHPRAKALGWSGAFAQQRQTGASQEYLGMQELELASPLIYSTELSRSYALADPGKVFDAQGNELAVATLRPDKSEEQDAINAEKDFEDWLLVEEVKYGLINLRTDGQRILMGVLKESGVGFHTEELTP